MRRAGAVLAALCLCALSSAAAPPLTVANAGPRGEIASVDQASEVRVVFSEPMVPLGRIPEPVQAPFFRGVISVAWPAQYQGWARRNGLVRSRHAALPIEPAARRKPLAITNPPPGAIYLRDPTLRAAYQTLPLRAVAEGEVRRLQWQVNGRTVGVMGSDQALAWPLSAGRHVIRVRDDQGLVDETTILVK